MVITDLNLIFILKACDKCYAWVLWFMDCGWWVWYELGMWFKWDGWYQGDMVLIWNTNIYSLFGKDELVWIQHLVMNENGV